MGGAQNAGGIPQQDAGPDAATDADDGGQCGAFDSSKPLVLYQSADDSNSMASPVIARSLINRGGSVPSWLIRPYEFLNYYQVSYPEAEPGHVRVVPQMRPGIQPGEYALMIGVQAEKAVKPRRPMAITFVLDTSGSMDGSPIDLERSAVLAIASSMQAGGIVSMVTWNDTQSVLLDNVVVSGPSDPKITSIAMSLAADGSTNLEQGLSIGYGLAEKAYKKEWMNRVVISDGKANTGVTDEQLIANHSHNADGEGIYLVGVGVGAGLNDTLMNVVTDRGRGAYVFLDSKEEADRIFKTRFDETMEVAVRDIRLELTVPWYFYSKSTSAEQTSTDPTKVDPQYLAPSDAIVFHNTFQACAPSMVKPSDVIEAKATYERPISLVPGEDSATTTVGDLLEGADVQWKKGTAILAWARTLQQPTAGAFQDLFSKLDASDPGNADPDLKEIRSLAAKFKQQLGL